MDRDALREAVKRHRLWLDGRDPEGRADLSGSDLSGRDLSNLRLHGADLSRANLDGANLSHTGLSRARLRCASLRMAELFWCDLRFADLQHAVLTGADLSLSTLKGADLDGAILDGATLCSVDLEGANLTDVSLKGVRFDVDNPALVAAVLGPLARTDPRKASWVEWMVVRSELDWRELVERSPKDLAAWAAAELKHHVAGEDGTVPEALAALLEE